MIDGRKQPRRAQKIFFARARASKISEERSPRYRASQKKDKKTARRFAKAAPFLGNSDS